MTQIRPFCAIRPRSGYESRIAALPYDVFSLEEARAEVEKERLSFLAIDRPEIISKEGEDIYENAGKLLNQWIEEGFFVQDAMPAFYLYELSVDGRSQTGIAALTKVDDYLNGVTKRHENTRADKEADRVKHVQGCMAQTGPIFLAYRKRQEISGIVAEIKRSQKPVYDFATEDGVTHRVWIVSDMDAINDIDTAFEAVNAFYIADGHHRCAAAVSCAQTMRKEHPDYTGEEPWNYILSVIFPDEELMIMDYNRVVWDLNGLSKEEFIHHAEKCFHVEPAGKTAISPAQKGTFGMYLDGEWYRLAIREAYQKEDPVEGLDVSLLQDHLLNPVLGIIEPRTDKRIAFVGGIRGLSELERMVNEKGGVAFSMYPTSIQELFAVADAGRLMPPKSTWFEPKLRSGLLISSLKD